MKYLEKIFPIFRDNWSVLITFTIIIASIVWGAASFLYNERIATIKEHVAMLQDNIKLETERNKYLDNKLKTPPEFFSTSVPAGAPSESVSTPHGNVKVHYPPIKNTRQLTKSEVRDLAQFYGLFKEWHINPHLRFKEGDISYWYEQGLSEKGLKLEFDSRRIILERAETSGERINSQGDLSHEAQQIQAQLLGQ